MEGMGDADLEEQVTHGACRGVLKTQYKELH